MEALTSLLNLRSRNDFVLSVAWLLAALRSKGRVSAVGDIGRTRLGQHHPLQAAQGAD